MTVREKLVLALMLVISCGLSLKAAAQTTPASYVIHPSDVEDAGFNLDLLTEWWFWLLAIVIGGVVLAAVVLGLRSHGKRALAAK